MFGPQGSFEHRTGIDLPPGERPAAIDRLGMRVTAPDGMGFLLLQGNPADLEVRRVMQHAINLPLPGPGKVTLGAHRTLIWVAPKQWLLELPAVEVEPVQTNMTQRISPVLAAVTEVSEAFTCLELSGQRIVTVLSTGCSLDLHSDTFRADQAARTLLADVPVILFRREGSTVFRCLVDRSYAKHLWRWLETNQTALAR
jgi:heterotetrameric sarcosine oxidase gamma subunit